VRLFSNWQTGKAHDGRGVLLLFVDDEKKVKIEVGKALEDVFTDAFTGYIQDGQLQPRYTAGQLDVGFIAVMEELEARARIKFGGDYTRQRIAEMDAECLSQGAGAKRNLETYTAYQPRFADGVNTAFPAGETPEAAWQTMLKRLRDRVRDPFLGVYTPVTRLAYRDHVNMPGDRMAREYDTYASKPYEIRQADDVAVIYFGKTPGWDNAPFLLCRTGEGWQFDIVHQRRFIRMGRAPDWGVEFSEHPHMELLMDTNQFQGQDIPLDEADTYTIDRDTEIADEILVYEALVKREPENAEALLALGRLYTITSMNQKGIPILKKAAQLAPSDPRPLKYLAIAHVDAYYQYDAAQKHLVLYTDKAPDDPFGHNFTGYIHYRKKEYEKAVEAFQKAVSLDPESAYAHFYLTRSYAWLYSNAPKADPRRHLNQRLFTHHREKMRSFESTHPVRVLWLNRWLEK
jgi:tetratricopeptide (TPR) repeat protein